jgi:anti-sigma B factor antagonist
MSDESTYAVAARGKYTVVRLCGRLEMTETRGFSEVLDSLMAEGGTQVVLDLSGVSFMSSSMIGLLLRARARLADKHGRLILASVPNEVHQTLRVSRLDDVFEIVSDVDGLY